LLRSIDRFVELDGLRQELAPFYSEMGAIDRPGAADSHADRRLLLWHRSSGDCARRCTSTWRIAGFVDWVSTAKCRSFDLLEEPPRRFRNSDLLRRLFETVLQRCIDEGLVGGEGFAVDAV